MVFSVGRRLHIVNITIGMDQNNSFCVHRANTKQDLSQARRETGQSSNHCYNGLYTPRDNEQRYSYPTKKSNEQGSQSNVPLDAYLGLSSQSDYGRRDNPTNNRQHHQQKQQQQPQQPQPQLSWVVTQLNLI